MPRRSSTWLSLVLLASILPSLASAQEPAPPQGIPLPQKPWGPDDLKPKSPLAIPDDPPPHEGAFIDIPYIIEPPDILVIEVLQALPGRPITGERLVRPDGNISLGFYGEVNVRGLTLEQAKVKIIRHLQLFLNDEVLGLIRQFVAEKEEVPQLADPGRVPFVVRPAEPGTGTPPVAPGPGEVAPTPAPRPGSKPVVSARRPGRHSASPPPRRPPSRPRTVSQVPVPKEKEEDKNPGAKVEGIREIMVEEANVITMETDPAISTAVFVDIGSYNSKVYFVQGDVGIPGRLPFTGKETVLDALNYSGGLTPTAEPSDVHLYRPARGGRPAREYAIDLIAILKGNAEANLQVFPDDRIVIGRNAIVKKTIELDRAASPIQSIFNSLLQRNLTTRSIGPATGGIVETEEVQRVAALKSWSGFLWGLSSEEGGAMLDDKAFREAVMKQLGPAPSPK